MELGERIDRLRETRGWTKKELAERLHLSPSMVSEWIRGVRDVTRENLEKLSDIFGVSVDYLLGRTDVPNPIAPAALSPHLPSGAFVRGKTRSIPVLGTIRAGTPILAAENVIGQEEVDVKIVGDNEADKSYFFLRVAGDSMAGARILENDLVLIHEQPSVENGEIAAVMIGADEAVLKRVFWRYGALVLQSDNPAYEPMVVKPEDVRIIGKVVRLLIEPK